MDGTMFMIETLAGSAGHGPATAIAQTPNALAVTTNTVYVCDGLWSAIRAIDLATGQERVLALGLADPVDVAADLSGNLFIVDYANHRILKRDAYGSISAVAGNGLRGFSGDGGPATVAQLDTPNGVFVDAFGALFIADTNNARIRRVDPDGTITTVAGSGLAGFGGDGGPASVAMLNVPSGVHVDDGGNLYIADTANHCIRRVDPTGTITTVAGVGTAGFSGDGGPARSAHLRSPFGVFVDRQGAIWVPDYGNERLRCVATDGTIATVAGTGTPGFAGDGGAAIAAQLRGPTEVGEDAHGNFYVSDLGNRRVRRITPAGRIDTLAGNGTAGFSGDAGPARSAQLLLPSDVCVDERSTYIADTRNHRIRRIDEREIITTVAGIGRAGFGGDGGAALAATLNQPASVISDDAGGIFFADKGNHRIRRVYANGRIATIAGNGTAGDAPDGGTADALLLNGPTGLALSESGELWIADTLNHRIRRLNLDGTVSVVAGAGAPGYSGDAGSARLAHLNTPLGLALAASGDLYVADSGNNRIRRIDGRGIITTVAGTGTPGFGGDGGPATDARLNGPSGLAFDPAGDLYIVDALNRRIRKVDGTGAITTIAGDGTAGLSGDSGAAVLAQLRFTDDPHALSGITLDKVGALCVADVGNNRIRRLIATAPLASDITLEAGAPRALSAPVIVTLNGFLHVLYRGRDGHIHELLLEEGIHSL
jgi:sugar lactone lactonase YvrE